jgi:hypothetical protein
MTKQPSAAVSRALADAGREHILTVFLAFFPPLRRASGRAPFHDVPPAIPPLD